MANIWDKESKNRDKIDAHLNNAGVATRSAPQKKIKPKPFNTPLGSVGKWLGSKVHTMINGDASDKLIRNKLGS